jgi:hypothetical protein
VQDDGTLLCQKSKKSCEFAMSWIVVNALQESKLDCAMQMFDLVIKKPWHFKYG